MKGSYLLICQLDTDEKIKYGVRTDNFKKGFYVYVGSALNNINKRVERHLRKEKKKHWHIDYFLEQAKIIKIKKYPESVKECELSNKIKKKSDGFIKGFGCTDCKCESHLYYFKKEPILK